MLATAAPKLVPHQRAALDALERWALGGQLDAEWSILSQLVSRPDEYLAGLVLGRKWSSAAKARCRRLPRLFIAQGLTRPEYQAPTRLPGSGGGAAVLPPEFKICFFEFIQALVIIASAGFTLGLVPLVLSEDFSKFFY